MFRFTSRFRPGLSPRLAAMGLTLGGASFKVCATNETGTSVRVNLTLRGE